MAHLQATRLRPILLAPDALHLRVGLLRSARVPYARVERVLPAGARMPPPGGPGYLRATPGAARLVLELAEPVEVEGPYGVPTRGVVRIGLQVDEPARFAAGLEERVRAARAGEQR